jgi:hypothetical protein
MSLLIGPNQTHTMIMSRATSPPVIVVMMLMNQRMVAGICLFNENMLTPPVDVLWCS